MGEEGRLSREEFANVLKTFPPASFIKESHAMSLSQSGLYFAVKQEQEEGGKGGRGIFRWWSSAASVGGKNYGPASRL